MIGAITHDTTGPGGWVALYDGAVHRIHALIERLPYPSARVQQLIAVAAVVAQGGIGVTGSVVRVTGSGLGCPTWPRCFPGSMFPVEHAEYDTLNQWIEFGNRLFTVVVCIVSVLAVLVAWRIQRSHPHRKRLVGLAWTMPGGVVAQAVIGGVVVLTHLKWWMVAIHFLVTPLLIWLSVMLLHAFREGDQPAVWQVPARVRRLLPLLVLSLGGLLAAGTTVTGAGPHAGAPDVPRLQASIELLAKIHGGLLAAFLVVLVLIGLSVPKTARVPSFRRRYGILWLLALAQGGLGALQYALGVPEALVSFHVLGAALVVGATAALWCSARDRGLSPSRTPAADTQAPLAAATTK